MSWVDRERIEHPFPALRAGRSGKPEILTKAGAIGVDVEFTRLQITGASNVAFTLADGIEGQRKTIVLESKGGAGNAVITPTNYFDGTTITLDAAGEMADLVFLGGEWRQRKNSGTTA